MWIKHRNILINLDKVQAIHIHTRTQGRCELICEYVGEDNEQWISFESKEKMLEVFEVITHALGSDVCRIDDE